MKSRFEDKGGLFDRENALKSIWNICKQKLNFQSFFLEVWIQILTEFYKIPTNTHWCLPLDPGKNWIIGSAKCGCGSLELKI